MKEAPENKITIENSTAEDIPVLRELFREYSTSLGVSLCFQNFEQELAELPGAYAPPSGRLLVARSEKTIAGCVALRSLGEDICEMKRLYVRPSFRNQRLGRRLTDQLLAEARAIGYKRMRLDTLPGKMDPAIAMYRSLGFREIDRYYDNPYPTALFMEMDL
jgi:ribosomal protein S18 acetylase RimI-like enzyme